MYTEIQRNFLYLVNDFLFLYYAFSSQSGQPYMNSDGSVYRFDPNNPPQLSPGVSSSSSGVTSSQEKESISDKETSSQPSGGRSYIDVRQIYMKILPRNHKQL